MKNLILLFVFVLAFIQMGLGQTQTEMNKNSHSSLKELEAELADVISQIKMEFKEDTAFINTMNFSQEKWKEFRDAEIRMKYPKRAPGWYGSNHSMCIAMYKSELTKSRILKLKEWIEEDPEAEKDACGGSQNR